MSVKIGYALRKAKRKRSRPATDNCCAPLQKRDHERDFCIQLTAPLCREYS